MIFQHTQENLLPWRTALDNVALPALIRGMGRRAAREKARGALSSLGLHDIQARYPRQLSGGQQQLVAFARWMASPPFLLFVDEAWSMIDVVQRYVATQLLRALVRERGVAVCVVSHSFSDICSVADRVVILSSRPAHVQDRVDLTCCQTLSEKVERLSGAAQSVFARTL